MPSPRHTRRRPTAAGFTLIELLVVMGILLLLIGILLPAVNLAYKRAGDARSRADLLTIATGLDAYKADFGRYPDVPGLSETVASTLTPGTGAHVLCQALFGLGPAYPTYATGTVTGGGNVPVVPNGNDGADGPGFRVRRTLDDGDTSHPPYTNDVPHVLLYTRVAPPTYPNAQTGDGIPDSFGGRVYGPYLNPENFRFDLYDDSTDPTHATPRFSAVRILDRNGNPILYYPNSAPNAPLNGPSAAILAWRYDVTKAVTAYTHGATPAAGSNYRPLFNVYDNDIPDGNGNPLVSLSAISDLLGDVDHNGVFNNAEAAHNPTQPYLLWSCGRDGLWGPVDASHQPSDSPNDIDRCDDITNFR